jgi:hypothetical protein
MFSLRYRIYHLDVRVHSWEMFPVCCIYFNFFKTEFHRLIKDMCVRHLILNKPFKLSYCQYSDTVGLKHCRRIVIFLTNVCNCKNLLMAFIIFKLNV